MIPLEICVDSLASARAAERGGAQRVELCSALSEGGLTPSLGLIRAVRQHLKIGVHVMIRPRAGDFVYRADEIAIMRDDLRLAAEAGADGVVLGLLTADGEVDLQHTREMVQQAHPLQVTFHRAIDVSRDLPKTLEEIISTGAHRILTSGGEPKALQGSSRIRQLITQAAGRIEIMIGSGVRLDTITSLCDALGLRSEAELRQRCLPCIAAPHATSLGYAAPPSSRRRDFR